jgi:hypothetical protein
MTDAAVIAAVAELLATHSGELIKQAIDIVESKDPDPIGQFELRRAAYYQALQARLDARFGGG